MINKQPVLFNTVKNFKFLFTIIFSIIMAFILEPYLTVNIKSFFFSVSNFIRSLLMFLLPILILPYIINSFITIKSKGIILLFSVIILLSLSNFIGIMIGYLGDFLVPAVSPEDGLIFKQNLPLSPLFEISFPNLIDIEKVVIFGFIAGALLSFTSNRKIDKFVNYYYRLADFFFQNIIVPLIPLYIFGVILKIEYETDLRSSLSVFGNMFLTIILIQICYLFLLFLIGANFNLKLTIQRIKNSLPAGLTGFSTMSRMVSLPVILSAAEKNAKDPLVARVTTPMLVNAHALGECISLPIIILTVMKINNLPSPSFEIYFQFAIMMALAQLSAVSVPGGSLIVLMPFLHSYFGFNQDMIALMFAFDIFFDSIGTAMNTFGDLAIISFIEKIWARLSKKTFKKEAKDKNFS